MSAEDFSEDQRAMLAALADVLIPANREMPSASQAAVAGNGLDQVLAARPDLVDPLRALLSQARDQPPEAVIADLQANDPAGLGILAEIVPAAYFMNPAVLQAIGYAGQQPRPIDPAPDYLADGLLESVIQRGPIYRPTQR
jgi:hypothetical protein